MALEDSQKLEIKQWIDQGVKLGEIQKRLLSDFGISMTYMEVKFLIDDLDFEIKPKPKPVEKPKEPELESVDAGEENGGQTAENTGNVTVSLHKINKPGASMSGQVTFSDGMVAEWAFDPSGRLMLNAQQDGYQPTDDDVREFQEKLRTLLKDQGY